MSDRSEGGGVVVAVGVALVLILLLAVGGGFFYLMFARQNAMAMAEARMAMAAREEAQANLQRARAAEELAKARALPANDPLEKQTSDASIPSAIESVLRAQADAWNAGDIDKFMEHYWKSDNLTFSSGGKTTRGWIATLTRYREKYPTPEKMGRLTFDNLEITPLDESAALVLGQWHVERAAEPLSGNFSLVVRKLDDQWRIIHDHTSRLE